MSKRPNYVTNNHYHSHSPPKTSNVGKNINKSLDFVFSKNFVSIILIICLSLPFLLVGTHVTGEQKREVMLDSFDNYRSSSYVIEHSPSLLLTTLGGLFPVSNTEQVANNLTTIPYFKFTSLKSDSFGDWGWLNGLRNVLFYIAKPFMFIGDVVSTPVIAIINTVIYPIRLLIDTVSNLAIRFTQIV